jgi:hypothetical protein
MIKDVQNVYIEEKITDSVKRLAHKVKIKAVKIDTIPNNIKVNNDTIDVKWSLDITYKGRVMREVIYMASKNMTPNDEPRTEYVITTLFCNSLISRKYGGDVFSFINDFPLYAKDFLSAEKIIESLKAGQGELKNLFGDDYDLYEKTFSALHPFFDIFNKRKSKFS